MIHRAALALRLGALVVGLAACWRSSSPPPASTTTPAPASTPAAAPRRSPPPTGAELALQQMERFADDMCNCRDQTCTQQVIEEMTRWSQEQAKALSDPPKMTEADTERAAQIGERMGMCMQQSMSMPSTGSATP